MAKKNLAALAALLAVVLAAVAFATWRYFSRPDGSTRASREQQLAGTPAGAAWHIVQEQELDGYLVSAMVGDGLAGIALFEPEGDGYRLFSREWRQQGEAVVSGALIGEQWYNLAWYNGTASRAELLYTVDGVPQPAIEFDAAGCPLICYHAPWDAYELEVRYYDAGGNACA